VIGDFAGDDFALPETLPVSGTLLSSENGTSGDDTVVGTGGGNYIDGKGGNDTLIGGPGDDIYKVYATGQMTIIENPGYGADATLTNDGDVWTIHYAGGEDHLKITGVTQLSHADYLLT